MSMESIQQKANERRARDADEAAAMCDRAFKAHSTNAAMPNISPFAAARAHNAIMTGWLTLDDFKKGIPADVNV